jgi:hypothetical protein
MNLFEDIKLYLPKYLSSVSEEELFKELKYFPNNINERLYTNKLKDQNIIYQGDGVEGLLFVNLPDKNFGELPGMVISNTCDINPSNKRFSPVNIVYSPIINLEKYIDNLIKRGANPEAVKNHAVSIKKQEVTSMFYLPKGASLKTESVVFLDKINSCDSEYLKPERIENLKLFTLSDYGFYLFIIKLSIHFTRIRERVDRGSY